jgi:arylsulfatase A-like enzyme
MRNAFASVLIFAATVSMGGWASADQKPNFVFILIDDLGWSDLGCYGNEVYETPNLDRLASEGMRFTDAYAACPVCSPTRASLMTGKYPARLGMTAHIPGSMHHRYPENAKYLPAESIWELPLAEVTFPERLKKEGYATGFIGKWHLSGPQKGRGDPDQGVGRPEFYPEHQGFDLNIAGCALGAPPSYFDPYGIPNLPNRKEGEYLTDRLTEEAVSFIRNNREKPFLLYLSHYTVHTPMQAKKDLEEKYRKKNDPRIKDPAYAAKVEAMDASVGQVLEALETNGLAESTVVLFFSDNGGLTKVTDNSPLRSGKGHLYEGGVREPLLVRWPGAVEAGGVCSEPVCSIDFYPTITEMAGVDPGSEIDGVSLVPVLKETGELERETLFWHYPQYSPQGSRLSSALRKGDYKLIEFLDDRSVELYNVAEDIGESNNLAASNLEKTNELRNDLHLWRESVKADMPRPNPDFDPAKPQALAFETAPWER